MPIHVQLEETLFHFARARHFPGQLVCLLQCPKKHIVGREEHNRVETTRMAPVDWGEELSVHHEAFAC
jgi:hypothetical protein